MAETLISVMDAVMSRRSIRAFLPRPVDRELLERIFAAASRAPSGSNIQPWKVHILTGAAKSGLSAKILEILQSPGRVDEHTEEFAYYPKTWKASYIDRRRALGWGLYSLLGIERDDKVGMAAQHARNFEFFDAPLGLVFTTDSVMERGSWLDFRMFLQNLMLIARAYGLDTCPQAAFNRFHRVVSEHLRLPEDERLVCAMSLGYADTTKVVNTLASERAPLDAFVRLHE